MQKTVTENTEKKNTMKFFSFIILLLPKLLLKSGITFLHFKRKANKAGKLFKKELMKQGLDKYTATGFTNIYVKGSKIKNFVPLWRNN